MSGLDSLRQALSGPLAAMAAYPRFILYRVEPDPKRPGKTNKFPLHPVTRAVCGAASPEAHMTADAALAAARPGEGVGFYFDPGDGFWFLDVDGAYRDGAWSPLVAELDALLPGAAREVSHSGTGLHYFGRGHVPPHRCRDVRGDGLEFYTGRRFVALTGAHASGDAGVEPVAGVAALVERWFPPGEESAVDWTEDGPRPEWRGPTDDDDLIRRAMRSQSAAGIFQGKLTFAQLWQGEDGGKASEADMALAAHLAFWTGCDMPRMERLMLRSGLARDKWEREDYLRGTILKVCEPGRAVCQDAEPPVPAVAQDAEPLPADLPPRGSLLGEEGMAALFRGMVLVADPHGVLLPNGEFLSPSAFNSRYGGWQFLMKQGTEGAGAVSSEAFKALAESCRYQAAKVAGIKFDPRRPFMEIWEEHGLRYVNDFRPLPGEMVPGDVAPFLSRYEKLLPDERDRRILFSWVAAAIQSPGVKFEWSPVLQSGAEAVGKSLLGDIIRHALGDPYFYPLSVKDRKNESFTGWKHRKLIVMVDEVTRSETRGANEGKWKDLITAKRQTVEAKGQDSKMQEVYFNLLFSTNERGVFALTDASRRYAPFYYAINNDAEKKAAGFDDDAFKRWMDGGGMAAVAHWFAHYPIDPEFDPRAVVTAPRTSSWAEAVADSRDTLCGVLEEVMEGNSRPGLMGGWASGKAASDALQAAGYKCTPQKVAKVLAEMGFVPHPGLRKNGRTSHRTVADGAEVRLFIRPGHPSEALEGAFAEAAYEEVQKL